MKLFVSLKSKLIFAIVLTALLPLIPITFVVKDIIQKSMEVGLNEQAQDGFESALELAKENYNIRKETLITQAELLANLYDIRKPFIEDDRRNLQIAVVEWSDNLRLQAIELYDAEGNFVMEAVSPEIVGQKGWETQTNHVVEAIKKNEPYVPILENEKVVKAFAPIFNRRNKVIGVVVVSQIIQPVYADARTKVFNAFESYQYLEKIKDSLTGGFLKTFLIFAVVVSLLGTFIGLMITRRISGSISQLVAGTKELAAGNLDHKVEVKGDHEIELLVESFNTMAATMKENRKQLLHTERVTAWQDVARKIAHEIKNPLTPIQISVQHLKDKYYEKACNYESILEECTETITEEVKSMRMMVESFSNFARMPKPDPHPTDLNKLICSVLPIYRESHESVSFEISLSDDLPELMLDPKQIKRVFHNLITNSLESMFGKGKLKIKTQKIDNLLVKISICDTGKGIPPHATERVFEPYFTTKSKGTGLGLAIVNRIIKDHFGDISFNNKNIGVEFIITLPIK